MTLHERLHSFSQLGHHLAQLSEEGFEMLADNTRNENPWFTKDNVRKAISGIREYLGKEELQQWVSEYQFLEPKEIKTIAIVMAGNIPLVGFHDFLCVLISGHRVQLKLSSKDSVLLQYLIKQLISLESQFQDFISIQNKLENFDAIIATGSDNSARYFEYYFGKYPNIIRKNRTSCAVLTGFETEQEIQQLGIDIFSYFGLGCRNISKIFVPHGYDFPKLLSSWDSFKEIVNHHKYANNYDYQKSIYLINGATFLDTGFLIVQENAKSVSPISVLYYEVYISQQDLKNKLSENADKIQCIVGNGGLTKVPFGQAQVPKLWDYADQIDTLKFIEGLSNTKA